MQNSTLHSLLSLSWQSIAYGVGIFGQQFVTYLTLPILTTYLSQTDFGVISVLIAFFSFLNVVSNAGLPAATFRMYNEDSDPESRALVLGTSQILFLGYALLMTILVWIFAEQISSRLLGRGDYVSLIRMVAIYLTIYTLIGYGNIILRIQIRPLEKSIHNVLWILMEYGLAIGLVVAWHQGVEGYWQGRLFGGLLALLAMFWLVRHSLYWRISGRQFKEIFMYALPMIPATLALWALQLVDRALITSSIGLAEVAVYEVGYKIGMLSGLITIPFLAAWPQFAFSAMHKPESPRIYRDVATFLAAGCVFLGLSIILFRDELVMVLSTAKYTHAGNVVPWIVLSQIAWALYPVLSMGPKIKKRTAVLAWITGFAALINIVLNLLLIPTIGIQGAAIATFVAYALLGVLTYAVGQKYFSFPLDWSRLGKLCAAGVTSYVVALQLDRLASSLWLSLVGRALVLGLVFPILLLVLRFVSWRQIWQMTEQMVLLLQSRLVVQGSKISK